MRNEAPTDPPTDPKTTGKKRRSVKDADYERDAMEADLRQQMADMEAKFKRMMEAELAKKDAEILDLKKKPVRKAREPKPPEFWEGQIETAEGWKFIDEDSADNYADATIKDKREYRTFMNNWNQPFAEKKEKTTKKRNLKMKPPKEGLTDDCRCEAFKWDYDEEIHKRCSNEGKKNRADRLMCGRCYQTAEGHMKMYLGWKEEYGTWEGWHDEERATIDKRRREHKKNPNRVIKPRKRKV